MQDFLKNFSLEGKVAWITGASYGLGLAYAKAYAEAGAKVVFNDINQELVDRGLAEYKKLGIKVYGAVCDVTNEKQVEKFVSDVEKKVGPIDILVNNEIDFEKRSLISSSFEKTVKDEGIIVYETEKNRSIELDTDGLNWPTFRKRKVIQLEV